MEYQACLVSKSFGTGRKKIDQIFTISEFISFLSTKNGKDKVSTYQEIYEGVGICRIANGNPYLITDDPSQWNDLVATVMTGINGALKNAGLMKEFSTTKIEKAAKVIYR